MRKAWYTVDNLNHTDGVEHGTMAKILDNGGIVRTWTFTLSAVQWGRGVCSSEAADWTKGGGACYPGKTWRIRNDVGSAD